MKITEKTVFIAACGVDEKGTNKSITKVETNYLNVADNAEKVESEITMDGAVVNIFRSLRYTMIDFQFTNSADCDYVRALQLLKEFSIPENSLDTESSIIPCIQVTVMPKELEGKYFITGIHGTWCAIPSEPNRLADTIRFIFENGLVHTYRINEKNIDYDELEEQLYADAQNGTT